MEQVRKDAQIGDKTFKVHLDGYNLMPFFKGDAKDSRREFLYWNDDGELVAIRIDHWKSFYRIDRCIHECLAKAKWHSSVGAEKADLATVFEAISSASHANHFEDVCPAFVKGQVGKRRDHGLRTLLYGVQALR